MKWQEAILAVAFLLAGTISIPHAEEPPTAPGTETEDGQGFVARFGSATASLRLFGDVGAQYDSTIEDAEGSETNFLAGTFDLFASVRLTDHLQTLSEVVAEFDDDTNEVGFELERLWALWSLNDAFYVKLGREHSPLSHWNRRYHHGRIFWPAVTQPFLARFEDQGGPLPIHHSGVEVGGALRTPAGTVRYVGVVSNGRGFERTEVTNVRDRDGRKAWDVGASFSPDGTGLLIGMNYRSDRIPPAPAATRETIVTLFGDLRAGPWEAIAEAASIEHEALSGGPRFRHRSGYFQLNYVRGKLEPYFRLDLREMDAGDPFYLDGDFELDRWDGLAGVRIGLGDQAALRMEAGGGNGQERDDSGAVTRDDFILANLAVMWVF